MRSNAVLSDELTIELIKNRLNSSKCYHGFVLDNFPQNRKQAELMVKNNIRIHQFFDLCMRIPKIMNIYNNRVAENQENLIETQFDKAKVEGEEDEGDEEEKVKVKTLRIVDNRLYSGERSDVELIAQIKTYQKKKLDLMGF